MKNKDFLNVKGKIKKSVGNNDFLVELENGQAVTAIVTSRYRASSEKGKRLLTEGAEVLVEIPFGEISTIERGRIIAPWRKK